MLDVSRAEMQFAIKAMRASARLTRQVQKEMLGSAIRKNDRSPVTAGDFAVQAYVAHLLHRTFPGDALVAEENSDLLRSSQAKEVLDFGSD